MPIPNAEEFFGEIEYIILSSNGGYDSDKIISMIQERDEAIRNELRKELRVVNYKPEEGRD